MSWTVHLARKQPGKLAVCAAAIVLASAAGGYVLGGPAVLAVALAMIASLADFLFPVTYIVTREGASCRMLLKSSEIRWENVKHAYLDNLGVKLSPLASTSKREAFRGVYLRFDGNDEDVTEVVRSLRGAKCSE